MKVRALALGVVLLAGCGNGGGKRLTSAELARKADAICADQARRADAIPRGRASARNAAGYLGALITVVEDGVGRFHNLRPPKARSGTYGRLLDVLDQQLETLHGARSAALKQNRALYAKLLDQLRAERRRTVLLEQRLGFTGCLPLGSSGP